MVEREIYTALKNGLAWFTEDSGLRFENFLTNTLELGEDEVTNARAYFAGGANANGDTVEARPPTIQHGYARTGGPFPLWAITLGNERTSQEYLNKDAAFLDENGENYLDSETGNVEDPHVVRKAYTFQIYCLTENADLTVIYYQLLKRIILGQKWALEAVGIDNMDFSGADLMPDPRYLPSDMFARVLTFTCEADEVWPQVLDTKGKSVRGIAVDDTENSVTAGDTSVSVSAGVRTY